MTVKSVNQKTGLQRALREAAKGLDVPALPALKGKNRALPSAEEALIGPDMDVSDLRVAMFSGNYNYVRDGANQALNRLADYLLRQGAACEGPEIGDGRGGIGHGGRVKGQMAKGQRAKEKRRDHSS